MARRSQIPAPSMISLATVATTLVVMLHGARSVDAYAIGPTPLQRSSVGNSEIRYSHTGVKSSRRIQKRRKDWSPVTLYLFPTQPSVSAANLRHPQQRPRSGSESKTSLPAMSDSVLASSDILPSFHTAHGLLSPEVVMRIADSNDLEQGGPLHKFLKTYKSRGPMACLPMLSDPCILPELTKAMREIA